MINFLRFLKRSWQERYRRATLLQKYNKYKDATMIPEQVYAANLELAARVQFIPGCVVECGVWRGGMSAGMAEILGPDRRYYLFDSFEGLPQAKAIDGIAALEWQKDTGSSDYHDNCKAPIEVARQTMTKAGVPNFKLVQGWFNETVPQYRLDEPIALLRLDGDWYDSTMVCLEGLFDQLSPGGLIILDDYHTWDGCSRAVHDFLSRRSATERIQTFKGICFLVKTSPAVASVQNSSP